MRILKATVEQLLNAKAIKAVQPFDYLTVGREYTITLPKRSTGDIYFKGPTGSTFIRFFQVCRALECGAVEVVK